MAGKKKIDGANDNSGNWGGPRPNSGRPTMGEVINIRQIMDEHIDIDVVMQKLYERIESGDHRAIELFFKYRAGLPKQELDLKHSGEQDINFKLKDIIKFTD